MPVTEVLQMPPGSWAMTPVFVPRAKAKSTTTMSVGEKRRSLQAQGRRGPSASATFETHLCYRKQQERSDLLSDEV